MHGSTLAQLARLQNSSFSEFRPRLSKDERSMGTPVSQLLLDPLGATSDARP